MKMIFKKKRALSMPLYNEMCGDENGGLEDEIVESKC